MSFLNDAGVTKLTSYLQTKINTLLTTKQDKLVSRTNIKTVNNTSLLGSGNISVQEKLVSSTNIKTVNSTSLLGRGNVAVQETLVSGTNIKTINGNSLLGSGNISIQEGSGGSTVSVSQTLTSGTEIGSISVDGTATKLYAPTPQNITIDSALSSTSTNPVQNKVINSAISAKYTKPSGGIPASDLASGVIPTVPSAYSNNPAMDGTASPGSGTAYALGNHVHPTDTTRQATLVSGTNIKTVNGNSLLGSGDLTVSGLPSVTTADNGKVLKVVDGEWEASTGGSGLTDPGTLPSLTTTVSSETLTITWSAGTLPS